MWRRLLLIAASMVAFGFCFGCGVGFGLLGGNRQMYYHRFLEEQEAVAPILAADPAFADVELSERSNGGIFLDGYVPSSTDLDRLSYKMKQAIGETRAREALSGVSVRK